MKPKPGGGFKVDIAPVGAGAAAAAPRDKTLRCRYVIPSPATHAILLLLKGVADAFGDITVCKCNLQWQSHCLNFQTRFGVQAVSETRFPALIFGLRD